MLLRRLLPVSGVVDVNDEQCSWRKCGSAPCKAYDDRSSDKSVAWRRFCLRSKNITAVINSESMTVDIRARGCCTCFGHQCLQHERPVCILTLAPAGCTKLCLLAANICAWVLLVLTIHKKLFLNRQLGHHRLKICRVKN
jgi:hypothetical protein